MKTKRLLGLLIAVVGLLFSSGCSTVLTHVPSEKLDGIKPLAPAKLVVADIGDARNEAPNAIGFGFSYWLPQAFWAKDASDAPLPVAHFIADSLTQDMNHIGHRATFLNKSYKPMDIKTAVDEAKKNER